MNETTTKIVAICLFAATYILLLIFSKHRAYIALGSALIFIVTGIMPLNKIFATVNWNVLLMLLGTMGLVSLFIDSKMPALLGDIIIKKMPNVKWAIISLSLLAGLISAFVDNVATVLMLAPIAINIAKKLKISPVPGVIAIAISSNLQGAATLVGDTTSILLGSSANLTFFDFFFFQGKMGMFWIVQISAIAAALVLLFLLRKQNQPIAIDDKEVVNDYFPTVLMVGMVILLIAASFIPQNFKWEITNGLICVGLFLIGLVRLIIKTKDKALVKKTFKSIDYITLLLLTGLFIVVGGITEAGLITDVSNFLAGISSNLFVIYTIIVFFSVILSAFIDNIPYVATMLPVVSGIAAILGVPPYLLYFGLLAGATLGGNLTPIGASANIAALGILRKEGHEVKASQFMKMSIPFTLTAVLVGYGLIWLVWH